MANFEFTETSEIDTVWFVGSPGIPIDWMAVVYRDEPDAFWQVSYRFRYHNPLSEGLDVHEHKDQFSCYQVKSKSRCPDKLIEATDLVANKLPFGKSVRIEIKGGVKRFFEVMSMQPFFHVKAVPLAAEPKSVS